MVKPTQSYLEEDNFLNAKIEELELRRIKEQAKEVLTRTSQSEKSEEYRGDILFYDFTKQGEGDKPLKK